MTISDKTRKLLWGRSGVRCAYCRVSLVMAATNVDAESIVGDECHIHARNEGGPRWNPNLSEEQIDGYDNLILLCKIHHKMIDDQPNQYPAENLRTLKAKHEQWVQSELQPKEQPQDLGIAVRMRAGSDILRIISQADAYDVQHDELETEEEVRVIGTFLQDVRDLGDRLFKTGGADGTRVSFSMAQQMLNIEQLGFSIFGTLHTQQVRLLDHELNLSVVVLRIVRNIHLRMEPPIDYYSCFISYSLADKAFARRLHDALQGRGIRCWLDDHQLLPGQSIYDEVDRGIQHWDKVLLCASEHALKSWWVNNEIEKVFAKEQNLMNERGTKVRALIPLSLDHALSQWKDGKADQVRSRFSADFTGWEQDSAKFAREFEKLVRVLRTDEGREEPPPPRL